MYDHVAATRPAEVLELGTAHGVGAAYMAAALPRRRASPPSTSRAPPTTPRRRTCWRGPASPTASRSCASTRPTRGGSRSRCARARTPHGNCEPRFDFVYLDGAKNWTIDGLAVVLIEKLLRPGGWLLMDDLDWTYAQDPHRDATDGIVHRELSEPERTEPHLRAVFELIVAQHPSFTELRVQDEWWGWARKAPGEPRRSVDRDEPPAGRAGGECGAQGRQAGTQRPTLNGPRQGVPVVGEVDGRDARSAGDARRRAAVATRSRAAEARPRRARPTGRRRRPRSPRPRTPRARSRCAPARTPAARSPTRSSASTRTTPA